MTLRNFQEANKASKRDWSTGHFRHRAKRLVSAWSRGHNSQHEKENCWRWWEWFIGASFSKDKHSENSAEWVQKELIGIYGYVWQGVYCYFRED